MYLHCRKTFCQVLEQPGQPRGAEQAGQGVPDPTILPVFNLSLFPCFYIFSLLPGVPDPAVLPVRHRLRQRDRPNPPSVPSLLAKHLLQGDAGSLCYGGRLLR